MRLRPHLFLNEAAGRLRAPPLVGHKNQVIRIGDVDLRLRELAYQRRHHRAEQLIVDLVGLDPLNKNSVIGKVALDEAVELLGEEAGNATNPRVGRLRYHYVISSIAR